jgi:hypothetical protein
MVKKILVAVTLLTLASVLTPTAINADPVRPNPVTVTPAAEPAPERPLPHDQLAFLGYEVTDRASDGGKRTAKDVSEIKRFQSKFGLKATGRVNSSTKRALDKYAGNAEIPKRCLTGKFTLCVNKYTRTVQAVSIKGNLLKTVDARFGSANYRTREGKFTMTRKGNRDHVSTLYRVNMPYPVFFSGGQAVHYSHEFASRFNSESHGCVGVRDMGAMKWMNSKSVPGTPIIVFDKAPAQP